ncbi:MAG TPA: WD40 repeat domain-containing protein [Gemmataceae bacterium]|nr:WD40 repeat domain-containing protein [Gemmataceae bacterium]
MRFVPASAFGSSIWVTAVAFGLVVPLVAQTPAKVAQPDVSADDGIPLPAGALHRFGNRMARHPDGINGSAVSPDGKYLATLGATTVIVWDVKTMAAKCILRDQNVQSVYYGASARASFYPDSKRLLVSVQPFYQRFQGGRGESAAVDVARVFDVETGKLQFSVKGETDYWTSAWLARDGKEIAAYSQQAIVYYDAKDGKQLRKVACGPDLRGLLAVAPGGNLVAFRRNDNNTLRVVDTTTGQEHYELTVEAMARVGMTPDGQRMAVVDGAGKIHIHDLKEKKELFAFDTPAGKGVVAMQFSNDQQTLYFGGQHGRLYRWDLKNNKAMPDVGQHSTWTLSAIALSPDESMFYSMGSDRLIRRWDLKTLKQLPLPEGYITQTAVVPLPDRKTMVVVDHAGALDQWDLQTGKLLKRLQEQKSGGINCVAVSNDGQWFAGGRTTQDVTLWDLQASKLERIIPLVDKPDPKGSDHVQRVAFSTDGKVLFTSSGKTGITAWEVPGGKRIWNTPSTGTCMAVDPKGRWIAVGGGFNNEQVQWMMLKQTTGEVIRKVDVPPSEAVDETQDSYVYPPYVSDMRFTPDGSRLISAHYDRVVRVWEPEPGREFTRFKGISQGSSLALSADGRWIGIGQSDKKITIWELASGKQLTTLTGHDSSVRDVAFTPDGRGVVGNADLAPILWDLDAHDAAKIDDAWTILASDDGTKAYRAQWSLVRDPKGAAKLFGEQVKLVDLVLPRAQFDKWIADLDDPRFRVREAAERDLLKAGIRLPLPWARQAMADTKSDEARARLGRVLAEREKPNPNEWRLGRAVQVLELAATDEATALLKSWAGQDGTPLTEPARAALERLTGR